MKDNRIKAGDTVNIVYEGSVVDWDVTLIHTPAGEGDLWQFQRPNGSVFALNPYGPQFMRIERPERPEKAGEE